jgi:nucleotide-binding universal stress UspA family protein
LVAVFAMRRTEQLVADAFVIDTESVAAARRMVSRQVAGWRSKLPDVDVKEVVEVGHPAAVIKQRATDADLVVLGGRGHGAVTGMPLGDLPVMKLTLRSLHTASRATAVEPRNPPRV